MCSCMGQKHGEQQRPCCQKSKDSSTTAYDKSWTSDDSTKSEMRIFGKEQTRNPINIQIKKRKWAWIGHTLRKPPNSITKQALKWNPQGKRNRGWPRNTWRRDTESELKEQGHNWNSAENLAPNRVRWREFVNGLCSPAEQRA